MGPLAEVLGLAARPLAETASLGGLRLSRTGRANRYGAHPRAVRPLTPLIHA